MNNIVTPMVGATCPALTNENYEYHLSGDADAFCTCKLSGVACIGRVIHDPKDQSSQFFSRAKCAIDKEEIKLCPAYGCTKETMVQILRDKHENEIKKF